MIKGAINLDFTIVTCVNVVFYLFKNYIPLGVSFVSGTE